MFKKITALVVVGFVALTKAESNLFSLFKAQAANAAPIENAESLKSNNWSADTTEVMTLCDTNRSGLITYSEALKCGGQQFWELVRPFDGNRDNMISRAELYNAVVYYHTSNTLSFNEMIKEKDAEIPDTNVEELKTFLTANVFGGLESFISYKTQQQIDQMFLVLDTNRDGKISKTELQTAARMNGQVIYDSQINPFYEVVDTNRDGGISKYELTYFIQSPTQWTTLTFKYIDSNRDGYINLYELNNFIIQNVPAHQRPSDYDIKKAFAQLDFNRDGKISWNELYTIMQMVQQEVNRQL
jgi:Ca2+-binding EF-hand superfamily protein